MEKQMPDDFNSCKTKDKEEYVYYACQFFQSLRDYNEGYWFGRLVAYGYTLEDFLSTGNNFGEGDVHNSIENGSLIIHDYTLLEIDYEPDGSDPERATATGKVELDVTLNGQRNTIQRDFQFKLKRTWHAAEMTFSTPV
jgi:hypothetical protein